MEKVQEYIEKLCPTYVAVPEEMLEAFIGLIHHCMRYPDILVNCPDLIEKLRVKAYQFAGIRADDLQIVSAPLIGRTAVASQVFLYFLANVV